MPQIAAATTADDILQPIDSSHNVSCESAPDFTTEITGTDRRERRVRTRIRNPFLPASVASVLSVVKLRIAHPAGEFRQKGG